MHDPVVTAWVEQITDGAVVDFVQVAGGGRSGYFVDVREKDGSLRPLFLQRGGRGGVGSFMGFAA